MRILLCVMLVCAALPVVAQEDGGIPDGGAQALPPTEMDPEQQQGLWGSEIRELVLDLPANLDRGTAEQLLGIKRGDRLDPSAIRRGVRRMALLGKLEDVRIYAEPLSDGPDAVRLIVQVVGATLIRDVKFVGAPDVPVSSLRRGLPIAEGDLVEEEALEKARAVVKANMAQEGYPDAIVEAKFDPQQDPSSVTLEFRIKNGLPQKIERVRLVGDLRYPEPRLLDIVNLPSGGLASRSRLENAAEALLKWYRSQGHYSAVVEPLAVPVRKSPRDWVPLAIKVRAGPRWVVAFRGNHVFRSDYLKSALGLPPDRVLDKELATTLEERVRKVYVDAGYYHARVVLRSAPGTERGTRRLLFFIKEGTYTELGSVTLKGNTGTIPQEVLVDEAVGAASETLPRESPIFQRIDEADVNAVLASGDSELEQRVQKTPPPGDTPTEVMHHWPAPPTPPTPSWMKPLPSLPSGPLGYATNPETTYDRKRFEQGGRAMEDFYRSRGYLQPRVQGPVETFTMDGARVDIQYVVNAGVQTHIKSVLFSGNNSIDTMQLLKVAASTPATTRVESGAPMDLFAVEEVRGAIELYYRNEGFASVEVIDAVTYAADQAELVYVIKEGERVLVKDIIVRGNEETRAVVITTQLPFEIGRPYRQRDIDTARRRLLNLGLFTSVSISLLEQSGPQRTVVVEVRERPFNEREFGAGASIEQGPRLMASRTWRNLWGLGMVFAARGRVNWPYPTYYLIQSRELRENLLSRYNNVRVPDVVRERLAGTRLQQPVDQATQFLTPVLYTEVDGSLSVAYPRILYVPFQTSLRGEAIIARANRLAFNLDKLGFVITANSIMPPLRYLRASIAPSFGVQVSRLTCQTRAAAGTDQAGRTCERDIGRETRRLDAGVLGLATWRLPVTLDGRDNIFKPHSGYLATGSADLVLGGGSLFEGNAQGTTNLLPIGPNQDASTVRSTFGRVAGGVTGYLPVTRTWTFAMNARAGLIVPIGPIEPTKSLARHHVPLFERFYLGGSDSVRGYTPDGVLASDLSNPVYENGQLTTARPVVSSGGNAFWNLRAELRVPLISVFELGVFTDAGQLIYDPSPFGMRGMTPTNQPFKNWDLTRFSMGSGVGLRANTPVGPLVFDVGFAFWDGPWRLTQSDIPRRLVVHPAIGYF